MDKDKKQSTEDTKNESEKTKEQNKADKKSQSDELDRELKDTFPASDPVTKY